VAENGQNTDIQSDENTAAEALSTDAAKQLLVVDPNPIMGRILGRVLGKSNLSFDITESGEQALEFCKENSYDMILMETHMQGMSGVETTKKIRQLNEVMASIPIIAVSARVKNEDMEKYTAAGMSTVLKKPVNEVNLLNILREELQISLDRARPRPPEDDEIYAMLDENEMALLNWDTLDEYSALLEGEYEALLKDFLIVAPDIIGNIGEAIIDGNVEQVTALTHQFKSTSLVFGAEDLSNTAAQLEILGRSGNLENANQFFKELHMIFEHVKPVLRKKLMVMLGVADKDEAANNTEAAAEKEEQTANA